jgi:hypothetical protein
MRAVFLIPILFLPSCAGDGGDWPKLVPIDGILAQTPQEIAPQTDTVGARAAALQARAAALRGPVIDAGDLPN